VRGGVGALLWLPQQRGRHRQVHPQQEVLLQEDVLPAVEGEVDERAGSAGRKVVAFEREVERRRRQQLVAATSQSETEENNTTG